MIASTELQQAAAAMKRLRFDEAQPLLVRHLASQPGDVRARWLLLQCLESMKDRDGALEQLRLLLAHVRKDLAAIDQVAGHARRRGYPLDTVLRAYKRYLEQQPKSANAAFNYAYNLARDGQFEAAIRLYERALRLGISAPEEVHLNIANICMDHLGAGDKAREHLERALSLNPTYSAAFYNLGNLAEQEGNREEAAANFERCLAADPDNTSALARLADTRTFADPGDPLLARLVEAAGGSNNTDLHLALGKAYEQLGDYEAAWRSFSQGNALDRRAMPAYDPARAEDTFRQIETQCSHEWLALHGGSSARHVFICGMFRSGSTLLEQMLAAHPSFQAGGESEFFPRLIAKEFPDYPGGLDSVTGEQLRAWRQQHAELTSRLYGTSSRLTDKRPDNILYVGLIKAILPSAKFVVTERDWRDVATSIYSVRLAASQPYATRLKDIRHYAELQEHLVGHWQSVLGDDLLRVRYEDVVTRPEETLTGLLDWLGEAWDERCLSFHEQKNRVRTASVWQVREPIHDKSIGRWKHYRRQFAEELGADPES